MSKLKKGEKVAMGLALAAIGGVVALAVVMETGVKKGGRVAALPAEMVVVAIPGAITPDLLPDAASAGGQAYGMLCMQCHDLPPPAMHSAEEWGGVLARMRSHIQERHSGMMSRLIVPTERDWATLEAYLGQHARVTAPTS